MANIKLAGDRPFPFIFCSKNYALASYGATISSDTTGSPSPVVNSSFPLGNLIDGNRSSYVQVEKLGRYANSFEIKVNINETGFPNDSENTIDMLVIENDPRYPVRYLRVRSYTSSDFSTGEVEHKTHSIQTADFGGDLIYFFGIDPRVDRNIITPFYDTNRKWIDGLDGRRIFILLENSIDSSHPYVKISIKSPTRNITGWDGTWSDGLWNTGDEVIETSDPAGTGWGSNNNHIKIWTDTSTGGHQEDQISCNVSFAIVPNQAYIMRWIEKQIGYVFVSGDGGYRVSVFYYDRNFASLGNALLYRSYGSVTNWTKQWVMFNYYKRATASRWSCNAADPVTHQVPDGTEIIMIRFLLKYDAAWPTCTWKIDDWMIYNATSLPARPGDYLVDNYANDKQLYDIPLFEDLSGTVKINRIGLYGLKFATSKFPQRPTPVQDLAGEAGASPISIDESTEGKVAVRNFNGDIVSQFIKRSGIKIQRTFNFIVEDKFKSYIADLNSQSTPFGIIDPSGEFGDFIISPGSLNWKTSDHIKTHRRGTSSTSSTSKIRYLEAEDLWNGTFVAKEV